MEPPGLGSCVYFPSQACLLRNSIQRALAKPRLILEAILRTAKGRKIKINQPPLLLSWNFLSWQEPAALLLPRGGNRSWADHKTTVTVQKAAAGTVKATTRLYSL